MDAPVLFDGAAGGDERLTGDLAAEHPLHRCVRGQPAEERLLERLDVEQLQQNIKRLLGIGHPRILSGRGPQLSA